MLHAEVTTIHLVDLIPQVQTETIVILRLVLRTQITVVLVVAKVRMAAVEDRTVAVAAVAEEVADNIIYNDKLVKKHILLQ